MTYRSYPAGSGMAGGVPKGAAPIVPVDVDWTLANGSRAQRRRLARVLKQQAKAVAKRGGN